MNNLKVVSQVASSTFSIKGLFLGKRLLEFTCSFSLPAPVHPLLICVGIAFHPDHMTMAVLFSSSAPKLDLDQDLGSMSLPLIPPSPTPSGTSASSS